MGKIVLRKTFTHLFFVGIYRHISSSMHRSIGIDQVSFTHVFYQFHPFALLSSNDPKTYDFQIFNTSFLHL